MELVDRIYEDNKALLEYLNENKEISFKSDMDDKLKKIILLSSASYFETIITDLLIDFSISATNNNEKFVSFIKNKGLKRQYHTLFDWDKTNINSFVGLFGSDFKSSVNNDLSKSDELEIAVKSFLTLGNERNKLVHINFANYYIDMTSEEIYALYLNATKMVDYLKHKLIE